MKKAFIFILCGFVLCLPAAAQAQGRAPGLGSRAEGLSSLIVPQETLSRFSAEGVSVNMEGDELMAALGAAGYRIIHRAEPAEDMFDLQLGREREKDLSKIVIDRDGQGRIKALNYDLMYKRKSTLRMDMYSWAKEMAPLMNEQVLKSLGLSEDDVERPACRAANIHVSCHIIDRKIRPELVLRIIVTPDSKKIRIRHYRYPPLPGYEE